MLSIQQPYISVARRGGASYGGGQQFSGDAMIRRCGCGIIAATDLLLYLSRRHTSRTISCFEGLLGENPVPFPAYNDCILYMNRKYFPMIPYAGINGLMLMTGVERFFHDYPMPYTARWCFAQSRMFERMEDMLRRDIPVIASVGPNFPKIWGTDRTSFYRKTQDGRYLPSTGAKSHFFTVTGMEDSWLRISSWGRLYYLNRWEFLAYARRQYAGFTSNILMIEQK